MNILQGVVASLKQADDLMLVFVEVESHIFSSLIIHEGTESFKIGERVNLIFKETEVMIATVESVVSARNSFVSKIKDVESGRLLSNITFDFEGHEISSVITNGAVHDLKCRVGDTLRWFVKTNEVAIQRVENE